jgi:hypothetical protein
MARTTLRLEDDLLHRLKGLAAKKRTTLSRLVNDLLRQALAREPRRGRFRLEISGWDATPQPGVDILDRDTLFDLMNGR